MATRTGIKDVAALAGVSVGTVSNVMNRPESVADETRHRVEEAIRELGFVRNASARQLRAGHSQVVGVVVLDLSNPFYTELIRGIEDRLALDDHTLMVCSSDQDSAREQSFLRLFAEQGVRGVVVTPMESTAANLKALAKHGIPAVLIDALSGDHASVGVDDTEGARQAVAHLLDQGHTRIGFLNGPAGVEQCQHRHNGAIAALQERGLDPAEALVEIGLDTFSSDAGQDGMVKLLDQPVPVTATFCVNDIVALGAMRELRLRNLSIPKNMAIVGYDDVWFASELMTPLSSVNQPMRKLGWTAADLLLNGATGDEHVVFSPELVVRESSSRHSRSRRHL
ncbi:MAG TPA: LacI family DNA-binding transcriptional regulator [Propionibacteriaceae bacterium]|nr:LacI family DNA-binding transcriptional regulator [Propionibacteriaceae bacterium]